MKLKEFVKKINLDFPVNQKMLEKYMNKDCIVMISEDVPGEKSVNRIYSRKVKGKIVEKKARGPLTKIALIELNEKNELRYCTITKHRFGDKQGFMIYDSAKRANLVMTFYKEIIMKDEPKYQRFIELRVLEQI